MKMKTLVAYATLLGALLVSNKVLAADGIGEGFTFAPGLYYASSTVNGTSATTTLFDIKLGYIMSNGLYLGILYDTDTSDSGASAFNDTNLGVSLGYITGGWNFLFHYILDSQDQFGTNSKRLGTGMILDTSYAFDAGGWSVGPILRYYTFTYTKQEVSGTTTTLGSNYETSGIFPLVGFWFTF